LVFQFSANLLKILVYLKEIFKIVKK
jgi:hypothetical protein